MSTQVVTPPAAALRELHALAELGYYRGMVNQLQDLGQSYPQCAAFLGGLDALVRQYQFEAVLEQLQDALDAVDND